jgi:hypothetical protein
MLTAVVAQAKLRAGSEVTAVTLDPTNSDKVAIRISGLSCKAAISTNAGRNFLAVAGRDISAAWSSNLTAGARRYVLVDSFCLFRSDDAGVTWTNTGASAFLREQSKTDMNEEEKWFREEYASRLPLRSSLWLPLFALFAGCHFFFTFRSLRQDGSFRAVLVGLRALFVLSLVWALLSASHAVVLHWTANQFPTAYWNTSAQMHPSPQLGLIMAIAAQPLPLWGYLLVLWPLLPGSAEMVIKRFHERRRRLALAICIAAGTVSVLFHLFFIFSGYFWE